MNFKAASVLIRESKTWARSILEREYSIVVTEYETLATKHHFFELSKRSLHGDISRLKEEIESLRADLKDRNKIIYKLRTKYSNLRTLVKARKIAGWEAGI